MLIQQGYGILQRLHFNKGYKSQKTAIVDFKQNAANEYQEVESQPCEFQQRAYSKASAGLVGLRSRLLWLDLKLLGFPYIFMARAKT